MLEELKLEPIDVDGCDVGVQSETGEPILKPWRIAINSEPTANNHKTLRLSIRLRPRFAISRQVITTLRLSKCGKPCVGAVLP